MVTKVRVQDFHSQSGGFAIVLSVFSLWNDVIESVKLLSISVLKPHNIAHIHS